MDELIVNQIRLDGNQSATIAKLSSSMGLMHKLDHIGGTDQING